MNPSAGRLKMFQACAKLKEIDRRTLSSLVKRIEVFEGKRVEIRFHFMDAFEAMASLSGKALAQEEEGGEQHG